MKQAKKHKDLFKFLILLLIILSYFFYLSFQSDFKTGGVVTLITWSFFVLCTPVADGGFLIDFPIRLLYDIRMLHSEIIVWSFAMLSTIFLFIFFPQYFETNILTKIFHQILKNPWPYWAVIFLSIIGTFSSIIIGDEIYDHLAKHKDNKISKKKIIFMTLLFAVTFYLYHLIIESLGFTI